MARNKGTFEFAANFEPFVKAPMDARMRIENYMDLIDPSIWLTPSGDNWLFNGAIVSVANDPSSGIYFLADSDNYTDYDSWIGSSGSPGPPGPSGGGGAVKRSFGHVSVNVQETYPYTINNTIDHPRKARFFERLSDNFTEYSNLLWSVKYENGTTYEGLQFSTKQEFVDFLNANTPHIGPVVQSAWVAELYALISADVGEINKMYGLNRFYSVLKGGGNYKSPIKELNEAAGWSTADSFAEQIWNDFMGADWFAVSGGSDYTSGKRGIWFSQQKNNIYALYGTGHPIGFGNGISGNRMWWNDTTSAWESADSSHTSYVTSHSMVGLSDEQNMYTIYGAPRDYILNESQSFVMVYRLNGQNGSGEDIIALMIKPIGIDILRLNYIEDLSNKSLYAIFYEGNNDTSPEVRKLSGLSAKNSAVGDISWMVTKSDWNLRPSHVNDSANFHTGHSRPKKFKFFVGDPSGNIGGYSPEVSPVVMRPGITLKTLVKNI